MRDPTETFAGSNTVPGCALRLQESLSRLRQLAEAGEINRKGGKISPDDLVTLADDALAVLVRYGIALKKVDGQMRSTGLFKRAPGLRTDAQELLYLLSAIATNPRTYGVRGDLEEALAKIGRRMEDLMEESHQIDPQRNGARVPRQR